MNNSIQNNRKVRVRFAPSPTGFLHIGSLRTALFNWLFARHHKGDFLVRVEDTDRQRFTKEHEQAIVTSLQWAGISADEPFVYQHDRQAEHRSALEKLIAAGKAYRCFCSQELLQEKREAAEAKKETYSYDGTCREQNLADSGQHDFVVRFKVPGDITTVDFHDLIRGDVKLTQEHLDDFVLMRTDGSMTYNFAVVIDDAFMDITHVIRGEDHIVNTGKQILLYRAFDWQIPTFAHLPLILSATGQKLSKRDAAVAVFDYKDQGVLADALCNYLVRLGWSHKDQEIFSKEEMIALFDVDGVGKKGSVFDTVKLLWVNSVYIKDADTKSLYSQIQLNLGINVIEKFALWSAEQIDMAFNLYKDRSQTLVELLDQIESLYQTEKEYDQASFTKWVDQETGNILHLLQARVEDIAFDADSLKGMVKEVVASCSVKFPKVAQPIRIALVGSSNGPGVVEMMMILGRDEVLQRLANLAKQM